MATLELPYGIEGFSSLKNLTKEDNTSAEVGESLDFRVTEFSKEEKRIMLSHTRTWQEKNEPVRESKPKAAPSKPAQTSNQPERGATLGDLDALAALKEQMEGRN
jgi:small subunit ribosomal protein S1